MATYQNTEELIKSLEELITFYDMNDDGTGKPFMALGFSKDVVDVFQRAKRTLVNAKKEIF